MTFTNRADFDKVFGTAAWMRKGSFLPADAFDGKIVVAVIKRGNRVYQYQIQKVEVDDGTVTIHYNTTPTDGGNATFASPMIVGLDKGTFNSVVYIENGKQAATSTPATVAPPPTGGGAKPAP